jgi:hypothetical protein
MGKAYGLSLPDAHTRTLVIRHAILAYASRRSRGLFDAEASEAARRRA